MIFRFRYDFYEILGEGGVLVGVEVGVDELPGVGEGPVVHAELADAYMSLSMKDLNCLRK